jgi:hypothetical protein
MRIDIAIIRRDGHSMTAGAKNPFDGHGPALHGRHGAGRIRADALDYRVGPFVKLVGLDGGRHLAGKADRNGALFKRLLMPVLDANRRVRKLVSENAQDARADSRAAKLRRNKNFERFLREGSRGLKTKSLPLPFRRQTGRSWVEA